MLVCLLLGACSDDGGSPADGGTPDGPVGDCTQPGRSCFAPFVCRDDSFGGKACLSPVGDLPTCKGTPAGQAVPFQPTPGGAVVHWALKPGCVATSHVQALASRAPAIAAAVKAFSDVGCSNLSLDPPAVLEVDPDLGRGERRIHFKLGQPLSSSPAVATATFEVETGRVLTAVVTIDPKQQNSITDADLLELVGLCVGLAPAPQGTDSVMAIGSQVSALTAEDDKAICALYGSPTYCGD